jgi:hypothetical protein
MRRVLLASALAVAGVAGVSAAGAAVPPRASLEGFACKQASNPLNRWMAVTAVMRPVAGTARMALKFRLLRKPTDGGSYVDVGGGDLGQWRSPGDPTLGQSPDDVWKKTKEVINLQGPAIYRFRVAFRWIAADGQVLSTAALLSRTCDQP